MANIRPELVSLVHHIELNRAGWWDGAIKQLVLATVWLSGNALAREGVGDALHHTFGVAPDPTLVEAQINRLCTSGALLCAPGNLLKIPEENIRTFENGLKDSERVEDAARQVFTELIERLCPTLDPNDFWRVFNEHLLFPLIKEIGARTYELLSGSTIHLEEVNSFQTFIQKYPPQIQSSLRGAIVLFMNPTDAAVRSYILRHLNTFFLLEASNLTAHTLQLLNETLSRNSSFNIFIDTNFLFSILGLHENPSNEAAESLMGLIKRLPGKITAKLYLFPPTIDEFKRVVRSQQAFLAELRLEPNLASVGVNSGLTGVALHFVQETKRAGHPVKAEDYFGPYMSDLLPIIRSKGLDLYNEKIEAYTTRQDVIDDIIVQQEYEQKLPVERRKSYAQLLHDVCLWHFVNDKRKAHVESPVDAKFWVATVDYRFLGYDAFKRRDSAQSIPICVHPTTLIQMMQLWVPRTADFEEAIVRSLRFAFLFHDFDSNSEKMTIRILESLSRFEDIQDLSEETITSVLLNQALRARMTGAVGTGDDTALIKEALIEEHKKALEKLNLANETGQRLASEGKQKDDRITALESVIQQRDRTYEEQARESSRERSALEFRMKQLESRSELNRFLWFWVIYPVIFILAVGFMIVRIAGTVGSLGFWWSLVSCWSILLVLWLYSVDRQGTKSVVVKEWRPFARLHKFKLWLSALLLGPVTARLLIDGVSKLVKLAIPK